MNADPKVMRYFPALLSPQQSLRMTDRYESLIGERGWGFWALELKQTGDFMGFVGLHIPAADLPFKPCVEVGWRLAAKFWGKGYATEAASASLDAGFTKLGLQEIVSFTAVVNLRSQAVMERLGMLRDDVTFAHPNLPVGSELREHCLYRTTRSRWLGEHTSVNP